MLLHHSTPCTNCNNKIYDKKQSFHYYPVMDSRIRDYLLEKQVTCGFKTQDEMADALRVKKGTLSKWLHGQSEPDIDSLQKIADGLGVHLQEVVDARYGKYKPMSPEERQVLEIAQKYDKEIIHMASAVIKRASSTDLNSISKELKKIKAEHQSKKGPLSK